MRNSVIIISLVVIIFSGCDNPKTQPGSGEVKPGPIADTIYVNVKMKQEIGLKDVAEGKSDIFFYGVDGPVIMGLDKKTQSKLDIYSVPSGTWSLLLNPIPNKAPYIVKTGEKEVFNPFALREVRFALNYLINRKYIVDEILGGTGGAMMTMATPGQPGTYKYNLIASKMGLTPEGNEEKGIIDITKALEKAAGLPELAGRLKKEGSWWSFDNEPIQIRFLIRVDDPEGRLKEGDHIAQLIEKTGIKVERLYWDRSRCGEAVYGGNPGSYEWNLYTEGWGAGATRAYWEHIVAQMYGPWYGSMPGGQNPDNWNYQNPRIDALTEKAFSGNYLTEEEYWDLALRALELGLEDAVRIYVCYQKQFYAANKARFKNRMAYGLGDGLNKWSLVTAHTTDKILRITGFSAKGSLFMSAWDPAGTDGFSDLYSLMCADPASDTSMFEHPATAEMVPLLVIPGEPETKVSRNSEGDVVGGITVPENAIKYNSKTNAWEKVGPGKQAMSTCTYTLRPGKFHHGRPLDLAAMMYCEAFREEWTYKDEADDRFYDESFESQHKPTQKTIKGYVLNPDETVTTYFDYNFPPSKLRVAAWGAPGLELIPGRPVTVSWEISEACALLVAQGSASGEEYSFTRGKAKEPDLMNPASLGDIRAKLMEMRETGYVPPGIKDFITTGEALLSYDAAITWIDEHGHGFIGCGPFFIDTYDAGSNYMKLTAFRDPGYPFTSDYWPNQLKTTTVRIDSVDMPFRVSQSSDKDVKVTIYVSTVLYPEGLATPAEKGKVECILLTPLKQISFEAKKDGPGKFNAVLPISEIQELPPNTYSVLVNAEIEGAIPNGTSVSIVVYEGG
ncbi:MAG: ABC transporter substrate-binding protein [Spirochaetales bacterium]|nr:ABC transporter substrate-binding protein [Spirochaetales bacterium]